MEAIAPASKVIRLVTRALRHGDAWQVIGSVDQVTTLLS